MSEGYLVKEGRENLFRHSPRGRKKMVNKKDKNKVSRIETREKRIAGYEKRLNTYRFRSDHSRPL